MANKNISNIISFMTNGKFNILYETIYNRFKAGAGFLEGDVVKLKDDFKSCECYKTLSDSVKMRLEDICKSGYNLRLGRLHTPNNSAGALGINVNLPATHADLYEERAPGSFGNLVTVPVELLETIDTGVNLPPVSSNNKGPKSEAPYQKPGKWKSNKDTPVTKEQNHVGHQQNWAPKGDYELAEKNKKIAVGANKYNDSKPSKFKALPVRESVEDVYGKMLTEATDIEEKSNNPFNILKTMPQEVEKYVKSYVETQKKSGNVGEETSEEELRQAAQEHLLSLTPDEALEELNKHSVPAEETADVVATQSEVEKEEDEVTEDTAPGLAQGGNIAAPEEREQTGALESNEEDAPPASTSAQPLDMSKGPTLEELKGMELNEIIPVLRDVRTDYENSTGVSDWVKYITTILKDAEAKDPQFCQTLKDLMNKAAAEKRGSTADSEPEHN